MTDLTKRAPAKPESSLRLVLGVLGFLTLWVLSGLLFGYPGVLIPALALVPVMFTFFFFISRG